MSEKELVPADVQIMLSLPVLPLRDVVIYPHMVIPLFVGREKSIKALEAALIDNKQVFLVAQRKSGHVWNSVYFVAIVETSRWHS